MKIKKILLEILIVSIEASLVLLLFRRTVLLASILATLACLSFAFIYKKKDRVLFVVAAMCGPFAEIGAIHQGAWTYLMVDFFAIPVWLPIAWGIVVVAMNRLTDIVCHGKTNLNQ